MRKDVSRRWWIACGAALFCGACEQPPKNDALPKPVYIDPERIETHDDIVQIVQIWNEPYFLTKVGKPVGMKVVIRLVSGHADKSVFAPGTILACLFVVEPGRAARDRTPVHIWEFDEPAAMNFRLRKQVLGGYAYGFLLPWPPELDLEGQRIEIEFRYRRLDGSVVQAPRREFKVPVGPDFELRKAAAARAASRSTGGPEHAAAAAPAPQPAKSPPESPR
jgi:hypothetical protein